MAAFNFRTAGIAWKLWASVRHHSASPPCWINWRGRGSHGSRVPPTSHRGIHSDSTAGPWQGLMQPRDRVPNGTGPYIEKLAIQSPLEYFSTSVTRKFPGGWESGCNSRPAAFFETVSLLSWTILRSVWKLHRLDFCFCLLAFFGGGGGCGHYFALTPALPSWPKERNRLRIAI